MFAIDVDGDGNIDALSASRYDKTIAWYENTNGGPTHRGQLVGRESRMWT